MGYHREQRIASLPAPLCLPAIFLEGLAARLSF